MSVSRYLKACRKTLMSVGTDKTLANAITMVIGNESADLDSCVSSIAYGYLESVKGHAKDTLVPILNMAREDVKLRAELSLLLKNSGVSEDDLVCRDEIPQELHSIPKLKFVLLDHNHFKVEGWEPSNVKVSSIIDHHVDEKLYQDATPRIIRQCGSCTSLVIDHFKDVLKQNQSADDLQLAELALSAILIDTSKLANQATETDFEVVKILRSLLTRSHTWQEANQYKLLQIAKRDVSGMTFAQLIRRDYKEWDLGPAIGLWGISSVTTSLESLTCMQDWESQAKQHATNRKLDVHMIMTKHGEKELFINIVNQQARQFVENFITLATPQMLLEPWKSNVFRGPDQFAFQQAELSATRKKVATICQALK